LGFFDWVSRRLRRKDSDSKEETKQHVLHSILAGESSKTGPEEVLERELGINKQMIIDDNLRGLLTQLSSFVDPDTKEEIFDFSFVAMRIVNSHLIRTSWLPELDAQIGMLRTKRMINRMKMNLSEEAYEAGAANVYDAENLVLMTAWCDSIKGRKAMLMKTAQRGFEIRIPEGKEGRKQDG